MTTGQDEPWTVLRLLQWTTEYFKKRGSETARLDAEVLLAEARGSSRIELYTAFADEPSPEVREAFREMVRRRGEGTPVAYLVGHKEFYSLDLRVNEATLIPRPETEHLVIEALDRGKELAAAHPDRPLQIADIGTGTGAIAIAVAQHLDGCQVSAVDLSPEALAVAKYNVEKHELQDRISLHEGSLLDPLPADLTFDLILSNPPYVSEAEYEALDPTVKDYEPRTALVSGPTGLECIEPLVQTAHPKLSPGGWLIVELSPMIAAAAEQCVRQHGGYANSHLVKDLAGHQRILAAQKNPA